MKTRAKVFNRVIPPAIFPTVLFVLLVGNILYPWHDHSPENDPQRQNAVLLVSVILFLPICILINEIQLFVERRYEISKWRAIAITLGVYSVLPLLFFLFAWLTGGHVTWKTLLYLVMHIAFVSILPTMMAATRLLLFRFSTAEESWPEPDLSNQTVETNRR
jgi:hypothetical protein